MYIDTHAHLDDKGLYENIGKILNKAKESRIMSIIAPATELKSCYNVKNLSENYKNIYFTAGIHPHEASNFSEEAYVKIENILKHPKAIAIGEVGLDYHYNFSTPLRQKKVFIKFIELSLKLNKPLVIHCREAEEDLLEIIKNYNELKGVVHCYTGNIEYAKKIIDSGLYIGFTGVITFKNSNKIRNVVKEIPIERILSETDSPYMAPTPHRGKINEPSNIPLIVGKIAEIKNIKLDKLKPILINNAQTCFNVKFNID